MDFLHPGKKRKKKLQLFIGYVLMGLALSIATFLVVIFTLGFDIDPQTGEVIRKGLVILDTHPEPAQITINGQPRGQTKARLTLPAGQYDILMEREGYRPWSRSIVLEGSSIAQLVYAFLFPNELPADTIATYQSQPELATQSPDRRWYLVSQPGQLNIFDVYDLNAQDIPSVEISLPPDTLTASGKNHKFTFSEWSTDNRHVLVRHTWSEGSEYIVIDRDDPVQSVNISKLYPNLPITEMVLRDKRANEFYAYIGSTKTLVQLNADNVRVTALLRDVLSFKPYKDQTILYTRTNPESKDSALVHILDGGDDYLIRELPKADSYMLDLAEYDRTFHVVVGSRADGKLYVYDNPLEQIAEATTNKALPSRVLAVNSGYQAAFSQNARFISLHGPKEVVVYDTEEIKQYRYNHEIQLEKNQTITWMDGHRMYAVDQGKTEVFDFDGSNRQTLLETDKGFLPVFNRDYDDMFQLRSGEDQQFNLLHVNLVVSERI